MKRFQTSLLPALGILLLTGGFGQLDARAQGPIIPNEFSVSTVPPNGDVNPYGVAFVPRGFPAGGPLHPGDILVSNFNNNQNLQGTGTTIVQITPAGNTSLFFQGSPGLGLTTALGVLKKGLVVVGNVPTIDGTFATIQPGSLLVLDKNGNVVDNLSDNIWLDGPWDLTINDMGDRAQIFVSDVLSGIVVRLDARVSDTGITIESITRIASGYLHRGDPAALVLGPAGLAYDATTDILYVASQADNAIFAVSHAGARQSDGGTGRVIYESGVHLHGPIGLALAPNGNLLTANSDAVNTDPAQPSEIVEFTTTGHFVAQFPVNPNGNGGAFGLALKVEGRKVLLAATDDLLNQLHIWTIIP